MAHLQHACLFENALPDCHIQNKAGAFGARVALPAIDFFLRKCTFSENDDLLTCDQIRIPVRFVFGAIYKQTMKHRDLDHNPDAMAPFSFIYKQKTKIHDFDQI